MELYETVYGIFDHRLSANPLDSVRYHNCENFTDHFLYDSYLEVFMYKNINKHTGLSFDEFLNKPRYEIEKILSAVEKFKKKESSIADEALDKLQAVSKA